MVINISEMQHDPTIKGFIYTIEGVAFMIGAFVLNVYLIISNLKNYYISLQFVLLLQYLSLFFSDIKWMALTSFWVVWV